MKSKLIKTAVALAVTAAVSAPAVAETSFTASMRIGALFNGPDGGEDDLSINSFGSRFIVNTNEKLGDSGLTGIGRVEVGVNANTTQGNRELGGFDRTRQAWGGLAGGFGKVTIGAQYASFYDMITSKGDIAWWGSCFVEFECSRVPAVLKYSGSSGGLSYSASVEANAGDDDNDALDNIEAGIGYTVSGVNLGAGVSILADDGVLLGLAASGNVGGVGLSGVFQLADEDFAGDTDDQTVLTLTGTYGSFYGLATTRDTSGPGSSNFTLGYTWNIAPKTLMYFEVQQWDDNGADTTIGRATLKRDFGFSTGS